MYIDEKYAGRIRVVCTDRDFPLGRKTTVYDLATGEEIRNIARLLIRLEALGQNEAEITFNHKGNHSECEITTANPEIDIVAIEKIEQEKKVYLCNDCKQAYDDVNRGQWVGTYMSNFHVWVCQRCLKSDRLNQIRDELLAWAGFHRGKGISEEAMPRFHEIIDKLQKLAEERTA